MRIAVIGSGISGSLAARLLSTEHDVVVYEAAAYPGGHANTIDVEVFGQRIQVDTGFMVFNVRTYPNFCRMLTLLGVPSQPGDMSFSVRCSPDGLEYQGSSLDGLFAQRSNCLRPSFLKMIVDILRFNRIARCAVKNNRICDRETVRDFLSQCRVGQHFVNQYFVPMAAAIWSSRPSQILDFPAKFMIEFFDNHGLLQLRDRPQWRTIVGGSRNYVRSLLQPIRDRVRLNARVSSVSRGRDDVTVMTENAELDVFDRVVFATHADQVLAMLTDASRLEQRILSSFGFQSNTAFLHTDFRLLPTRRRARASWNYHVSQGDGQSACVTYDLARLQNLDLPCPLLLTLSDSASIDPKYVLKSFHYRHPAFSAASISAQRRLGEINDTRRSHYCGAYWGYGFHEDGVNSAVRVARNFGIGLEACAAAYTREPLPTAGVCQ